MDITKKRFGVIRHEVVYDIEGTGETVKMLIRFEGGLYKSLLTEHIFANDKPCAHIVDNNGFGHPDCETSITGAIVEHFHRHHPSQPKGGLKIVR